MEFEDFKFLFKIHYIEGLTISEGHEMRCFNHSVNPSDIGINPDQFQPFATGKFPEIIVTLINPTNEQLDAMIALADEYYGQVED